MTCIRLGCKRPRTHGLMCTRHFTEAKARQRRNAETAGPGVVVAGGPGGVGRIDAYNWRAWPAYAWTRKREQAYRRTIKGL